MRLKPIRFHFVCDQNTIDQIAKLAALYEMRAGIPVSHSQAVRMAINSAFHLLKEGE